MKATVREDLLDILQYPATIDDIYELLDSTVGYYSMHNLLDELKEEGSVQAVGWRWEMIDPNRSQMWATTDGSKGRRATHARVRYRLYQRVDCVEEDCIEEWPACLI